MDILDCCFALFGYNYSIIKAEFSDNVTICFLCFSLFQPPMLTSTALSPRVSLAHNNKITVG